MSSRWDRLRNKEGRDGFSESQFDIEFPFQVEKLMEARQLSINDLVEKGIPRAELEGDKEYSRETMHKLASVFDVALLVTFVSFSAMVEREKSPDLLQFNVPSFEQDRDPKHTYSVALSNWYADWDLPHVMASGVFVGRNAFETPGESSLYFTHDSREREFKQQYEQPIETLGTAGVVPPRPWVNR